MNRMMTQEAVQRQLKNISRNPENPSIVQLAMLSGGSVWAEEPRVFLAVRVGGAMPDSDGPSRLLVWPSDDFTPTKEAVQFGSIPRVFLNSDILWLRKLKPVAGGFALPPGVEYDD